MSSRPPRQNLPQKVAESLDPTDFDVLERFCSDIEIEEISFEKWCDHHEQLDLIFHLHLSEVEARDGCEKQITFTRTIRELDNLKMRPLRKKIQKSIKVPANSVHGQEIILEGQGDSQGQIVGNLRVIINIK